MHKYIHIIIIFCAFTATVNAQNVINDVGLRLSLSVEKKINDKFTVSGKILTRQIENLRLFNRIYLRAGVSYSFNEHFETELRLYYMNGRKGFKEFSNSYRYSLAFIYKTKLNQRFSISNRLTYQITNNSITNSELTDVRSGGVVRDRITLKFKHTRRGSAYIKEEVLFQVTGKEERYFGRNRVYLGYEYKLTQNWALDAYFILERTHGGVSAKPKERNFYYGLNLGYNF